MHFVLQIITHCSLNDPRMANVCDPGAAPYLPRVHHSALHRHTPVLPVIAELHGCHNFDVLFI